MRLFYFAPTKSLTWWGAVLVTAHSILTQTDWSPFGEKVNGIAATVGGVLGPLLVILGLRNAQARTNMLAAMPDTQKREELELELNREALSLAAPAERGKRP